MSEITRNTSNGLASVPATSATSEQEVGQQSQKLVEEAKQQANMLGDQAQRQVKNKANDQKQQVASTLNDVAGAFRSASGELADSTFSAYTNQITEGVESLSSYIDDRSVDEIVRDTRDFARRRPEIFIGGAFAVGLAVSRFFKSTPVSQEFESAHARQYRMNAPTGPTNTHSMGSTTRGRTSLYTSDIDGTYGELD